MTLRILTSVSELTTQYDAFLLDLWGVIHDGSAVYPGVTECLKNLRAQKKKVLFVSNAPRRSENVIAVLNKLGITPDLYDHVVSSGEVAHRYFEHDNSIGKRYFYIGPKKDEQLLYDLPGYERMECHANADFVLNAGFARDEQALDEFEHELNLCQARQIPMVCINPDLEIVKMDGSRFLCAGAIAARYTELGGDVLQFGKPYAEIYNRCFTLLGELPKERIIGIGDNIDTDVAGANAAGITSLLIMGGILEEKLHLLPINEESISRLEAHCAKSGHMPHYAMAGLTW